MGFFNRFTKEGRTRREQEHKKRMAELEQLGNMLDAKHTADMAIIKAQGREQLRQTNESIITELNQQELEANQRLEQSLAEAEQTRKEQEQRFAEVDKQYSSDKLQNCTNIIRAKSINTAYETSVLVAKNAYESNVKHIQGYRAQLQQELDELNNREA